MKAVFFDIDGTLIEGTHPDYRYMRENVQKAIRKLQEQGHYVFIASGTFYNDYWVLQDMFADNSETNQTSIDYQSVENMQIDQYNQPALHLQHKIH